ncbi:hypothetical protein [Hallella seregens]|uniref:Uncharacterized protein n=1 Tax=Hallella seregens ATCC 51272 TaxID=1336250 RepID=A0ABV5ZLD3_9BACT|nr:hypothetical protein [Hallella seregens]
MTPAPELYKGQSCCGQQEQILLGQRGQSRVAFPTYEADGFINFFCTIKNTYIEEKLLDDKERIDYNRLKPVLFEMPTHKYLATGKILGDNVKMGKAYQSQMEK